MELDEDAGILDIGGAGNEAKFLAGIKSSFTTSASLAETLGAVFGN
jgi:hypothetical protein